MKLNMKLHNELKSLFAVYISKCTPK